MLFLPLTFVLIPAAAPQNLNKGCDDTFSKDDDIPPVTDETDNLSDIDDVEVSKSVRKVCA